MAAPISCAAEVVGRFAKEALALGSGEVCALFRRSFYLQFPGERYACVGDLSLGHGPLNALVRDLAMPVLGERVSIALDEAVLWLPSRFTSAAQPDLAALAEATAGRVPKEGLGCLIVGTHNALANHAQPALDALNGWLAGNRLGDEAESLIGLGPGLTPSGDDFLGGMLLALRACGRAMQADSLWRWLKPRLRQRTSAISGAHLAAAAEGEAHEALHECLERLFLNRGDWRRALRRIDALGHCSGWDGLAGLVAVARVA